MIAAGIVILALGVAGLTVTQIVLRRRIRRYQKEWEDQHEVY